MDSRRDCAPAEDGRSPDDEDALGVGRLSGGSCICEFRPLAVIDVVANVSPVGWKRFHHHEHAQYVQPRISVQIPRSQLQNYDGARNTKPIIRVFITHIRLKMMTRSCATTSSKCGSVRELQVRKAPRHMLTSFTNAQAYGCIPSRSACRSSSFSAFTGACFLGPASVNRSACSLRAR